MYFGVITGVINSYFPGNVNGLYEFYFNKKSSNENRPINTFKLVTINMIIFIGALNLKLLKIKENNQRTIRLTFCEQRSVFYCS